MSNQIGSVGTKMQPSERQPTPNRLQSPEESEVNLNLREQVRAQATLLQELVTSFRASENMRLLTAQRNKQLDEENKRLKSKNRTSSVDSDVAQKESLSANSKDASVGNVSMDSSSPSSSLSPSATVERLATLKSSDISSNTSLVTLTKEQMSDLALSIAQLKEVAFRRENTWETMAQRQVALQRQVHLLREQAKLADRQLNDSAKTIKDQATASKRDQTTIASLKRQLHRLSDSHGLDSSDPPSLVEVMAPQPRRRVVAVPRTQGDAAVAPLAGHKRAATGHPQIHALVKSTIKPGPKKDHSVDPSRRDHSVDQSRRDQSAHQSRNEQNTGKTREHRGDKRDHHVYINEKREYQVDKRDHYLDKREHAHLVDKGAHYVERRDHVVEKNDRREHVGDRRDRGGDRRPSKCLSPTIAGEFSGRHTSRSPPKVNRRVVNQMIETLIQ